MTPQRRRSIRLRGFDYRSEGTYFVTLVTFSRACVLGEVTDDKAVLSGTGRIVEETWRAIPRHYLGVRLGDFTVMPNHIHGILFLGTVGAKHASPLPHRPRGTVRGSLPAVVQSFKSAATRAVNLWRGMSGSPLWQRGYYEHVVRDDEELNRVRRYIEENPMRWALDQENPARPV